MGPLTREASDPSTCESRLGDHRDRIAGRKADARSQRTQEQPATTRRLRTTITQVGDNSSADVCRDWHCYSLPTLGANEHLTGSPVSCNVRVATSFARKPSLARIMRMAPAARWRWFDRNHRDIPHLFGGQVVRQVRELPLSD
jgi:hypothetical protein